jgi:hypothetical protein
VVVLVSGTKELPLFYLATLPCIHGFCGTN